jgi:SAM-dependent methyltransferase
VTKSLTAWPRRLWRTLVGLLRPARRSKYPRRIPGLTSLVARLRLGLGTQPLSVVSGSDRGQSIHRYYLDLFMREFAADIGGRCLEFQNDQYASRFGGTRVTHLDILHKEGSGTSKQATIVADLLAPNDLPSNAFQVIICTHTLHIVEDPARFMDELRRLLAPGGVLLLGVPHVAGIQPWWHELWRFTPEGLRRLAERSFGAGNVTLRSYGNTLTAAGAMRGLIAAEFTARELDLHDDRFAVEVCLRAVKA